MDPHGESDLLRVGEADGTPLMSASEGERPRLTFCCRSSLAFFFTADDDGEQEKGFSSSMENYTAEAWLFRLYRNDGSITALLR